MKQKCFTSVKAVQNIAVIFFSFYKRMHLLINIVADEILQAKVIKTSIKVMTSDQNERLSDQTDGYSSFYDYLVLN